MEGTRVKCYDDGHGGIACRTENTGRKNHVRIVVPWINDLNEERNVTVPYLDTGALHLYFREGIMLTTLQHELPGGSQQMHYFLHLPTDKASVVASELYIPLPQSAPDEMIGLAPDMQLASLDLYVASASMDNTDRVLQQLQDRVLHPEKYIKPDEDAIPF